jgi:hypothetical protein
MSLLPWPTSRFVYMPYDAGGSLLLSSACFFSTALLRESSSIQEWPSSASFVWRQSTSLTLHCVILELHGSHLAVFLVVITHF